MFYIKGYNREDYMALGWQLLQQKIGVGTNSRPTEWPLNADDIYGQIIDQIGSHSNEAYTFRITADQWQEYLILNILFGIVAARIKPETLPVQLHLTAGDRMTAVSVLMRIYKSDYEQFGSDTQPWWIPARTYAGADLPMPCSVPDEGGTPNDWVRISPIQGDSFVKATVERGEVTSASILEPLDNKQTHIEWILNVNDGRRWEIQYRREKALIWKFRRRGYLNSMASDKGKAVLYLLGMMTGAPGHYKVGYVVVPAFGVIKNPGFVQTSPSINALTGPAIVKEETNSEGPQMPEPGPATVSTDPSKTNVHQILPEPAAQPKPPAMEEVKTIPGSAESGENDGHKGTAAETPAVEPDEA
jgi:hypothetical protein